MSDKISGKASFAVLNGTVEKRNDLNYTYTKSIVPLSRKTAEIDSTGIRWSEDTQIEREFSSTMLNFTAENAEVRRVKNREKNLSLLFSAPSAVNKSLKERSDII